MARTATIELTLAEIEAYRGQGPAVRSGSEGRYYCPLCECDNERSLSVNVENGKYHCHRGKCNASGVLTDYKDKAADSLTQWATIRRLDPTVLLALGVRSKNGELHFPMRDADGTETGFKRRKADNTLFPKNSRKTLTNKGGKNGLFYCTPFPTTDEVLACEGEADTAAALSAGHKAVVGTPGATPGKAVLELLARLLAGRDVVLGPDPDRAAQKWLKDVGRVLKKAKCCVRVILPDVEGGRDLDKRLRDEPDRAAALKRLMEGAVPYADVAKTLVTDAGEIASPPDSTTSATSIDVQSIRAVLWEIANRPALSTTERHRAIADAVVQWLHARGRFYYHIERRDFDNVMYFDSQRKLLLAVRSHAFIAWLSDCLAVNRAERTFVFVQSACETEGLSDRAIGIEPATYWASKPGIIYLSNGPGLMARITADGVKLVDNGTDGVLFPYGTTLQPWVLTEPRNPFETCALFRNISTSAPHGRDLFILWTCSLPSDQRTKPPIVVSGCVGSGKTRLARGVFELYGLLPRIAAVLRNGDSDFWVQMDLGGLSCWDNADTRTDWLADALAAAATAGTLEKRRLYKDAEGVSLRARSWVCITSASPDFASDPGLADRLLVVRLNRRTGETAETVLSDEIAANRDAGLSWIAQTLSVALTDHEAVPTGLNARHPDFANLAVRIGRAMGRGEQAIAALRRAESDKALFNLENDWVGAALLELLQSRPFEGTAADLLAMLLQVDPSFEGKLSAKRLSRRLTKAWPHLETVFQARYETGHGGFRRYSFQSRCGDFGDLYSRFPEKSSREEKAGSFSETPIISHQSHHPDADLDVLEAQEERLGIQEFGG